MTEAIVNRDPKTIEEAIDRLVDREAEDRDYQIARTADGDTVFIVFNEGGHIIQVYRDGEFIFASDSWLHFTGWEPLDWDEHSEG